MSIHIAALQLVGGLAPKRTAATHSAIATGLGVAGITLTAFLIFRFVLLTGWQLLWPANRQRPRVASFSQPHTLNDNYTFTWDGHPIGRRVSRTLFVMFNAGLHPIERQGDNDLLVTLEVPGPIIAAQVMPVAGVGAKVHVDDSRRKMTLLFERLNGLFRDLGVGDFGEIVALAYETQNRERIVDSEEFDALINRGRGICVEILHQSQGAPSPRVTGHLGGTDLGILRPDGTPAAQESRSAGAPLLAAVWAVGAVIYLIYFPDWFVQNEFVGRSLLWQVLVGIASGLIALCCAYYFGHSIGGLAFGNPTDSANNFVSVELWRQKVPFGVRGRPEVRDNSYITNWAGRLAWVEAIGENVKDKGTADGRRQAGGDAPQSQ